MSVLGDFLEQELQLCKLGFDQSIEPVLIVAKVDGFEAGRNN